MSSSVNKVLLIGNLGRDPEVRYLHTGVAVATFPLATSETFTDKKNNEKREVTEWHNVVLWNGLAEIAEKYLQKGMKVFIEGKIKSRNWKDDKGNLRYAIEIIASEMTMLGGHGKEKADSPVYPATLEEQTLPQLGAELMSSPEDVVPF